VSDVVRAKLATRIATSVVPRVSAAERPPTPAVAAKSVKIRALAVTRTRLIAPRLATSVNARRSLEVRA
jgi:hypothetical protein